MARTKLMKQLEQMADETNIEELMAEWLDEDMCSQSSSNPALDPGAEVEVGEEGRVEVSDLGPLERIILPDNNLLPVHFLEEGARKQRAVARIVRTNPTRGWGTGWMVGRDLLMTNNHVIGTKAAAANLRAQFNYQFDTDGSAETPDTYEFDPNGFFYTNQALDFTLIKLKPKPLPITLPVRVQPAGNNEYVLVAEDEAYYGEQASGGSTANGSNGNGSERTRLTPPITLPPITRPPIRLSISAGTKWGRLQLPTGTVSVADEQHINIVQHPQGRRKEVAVQQNRLTNIYTNHLRYTTDTEPGSSGSPVFDNGWDLVAIHHAGGEYSDGMWKNNQGVRIDRIVADIRSAHGPGSYARNQLGI